VSRARVAANIRVKRIYDPPSPDDGLRILSTRYWPRGLPKAAVDEYTPKVAPSRELLRAFKHEGLPWEEYVPRYLEELTSPNARAEIQRLAALARQRTITVMCVCDGERCHRYLLRDAIIEEAEGRDT
jgi:uncharacterized protein YeaO (DUF488 family)